MQRRDRTFRNELARCCAILAIVFHFSSFVANRDAVFADEGTEFFEAKIRPVLIKHCLECHGETKSQGGLRLDHRSGWKSGGDSGPAIQPGDLDGSLLIQAIRYTGNGIDMPPKGKLPEGVIADLEKWVKMGAPDPRTSSASNSAKKNVAVDLEAAKNHWSYQPVQSPAVPDVKNTAWPNRSFDRFTLAGLEAANFQPLADTDRLKLVRRLYFDLWGLPPTPEEIDDFLADNSPDAAERLTDRLLASPRFGERWGRHWLDIVRFGESLTLRGFVMKPTWRYRDYVIQSWNADHGIDEFIREQIAGDLLPSDSLAEKQRKLVATTFLMLGNTNLEEQDKSQLEMDVIDEQLDVIGKGLLGQTLTCARCHDHKFDPIPTRDYYAMAGILRNVVALEHSNVSKMKELPLPLAAEEDALFKASEQQVSMMQKRIDEMKKLVEADKKAKAVAASSANSEIVAIKDLPGIVIDDAHAKRVGEWRESRHTKSYIGDGYLHDNSQGRGEKTLSFIPDPPLEGRFEIRLAYSGEENRSNRVEITIFSADGEKDVTIDQRVPPPISGRFVSLGLHRFERNGQGFVIVSNAGANGYVTADAVQFLPVNDEGTPIADLETSIPTGDAASALTVVNKPKLSEELKRLEGSMKQLKAALPQRPMVMTVTEKSKPENLKVHIRGSIRNLGETVPRGMLQVVPAKVSISASEPSSGRRELADWLVSRDNPLTSRVFVNRTWHWLMGTGLVRTADNFGTTGESPSHPAMLDHLTSRFIEHEWSPKWLVRQIVLSRGYQLSSNADETPLAAKDPENRLFGRANRRRLDAESIRDAFLRISGELDSTCYGQTYPATLEADYTYKQTATRRSVYLPAFRNSLPELFEAFDFADPSVTTGVRNVSTVPQQALFLLNHPFVAEQARWTARRLLDEKELTEAQRLERAYRQILGRGPSARETAIATDFLKPSNGQSHAEWSRLIHALFASIDFRYLE